MMNTMKMLLAGLLLMLAASAQADDGVARSVFTTGIQDREPVDQVGQLSNDHTQIYFFTEIQGMKGHTITHRWEQGGEVRAEVTFNVGGDRWRVWSSKILEPSWLGEWQVSVVDEGGNVLAQESFAYIPAGEQPAAQQPVADQAGETPVESGEGAAEAEMSGSSGSSQPATDMEAPEASPEQAPAEESAPATE